MYMNVQSWWKVHFSSVLPLPRLLSKVSMQTITSSWQENTTHPARPAWQRASHHVWDPPTPVAVLGRPGCPCTDQEADGNTAAAKCKRANTKSKQMQCSRGTVYKRWLTQLCVLRLLLVCTILKCKRSCMGLTALNLWAGSPVHIQTASSGNQTPCSQSYLLLSWERNQETKCPEPSLFTETSSCPQHHKTTSSLPQPHSVSCGQQISYLLSHTRPLFSHFCLLKELGVLLSYKVNTSLSATQHFLPGISKLPLS